MPGAQTETVWSATQVVGDVGTLAGVEEGEPGHAGVPRDRADGIVGIEGTDAFGERAEGAGDRGGVLALGLSPDGAAGFPQHALHHVDRHLLEGADPPDTQVAQSLVRFLADHGNLADAQRG